MDLSRHFNIEALSDVLLHVRTTEENTENPDPQSSRSEAISNARSFYLHKVILFQSPYFEMLCEWNAASASNAVASPAPAAAMSVSCAACAARAELFVPASSARTELEVHVEECELEAVELLLNCLYKAELIKEAWFNGRLLLQMYRLADKYEVPAPCLHSILYALSVVRMEDIDLPLLSDVYSLPVGLLELPPLQKMIAACARKLVELFDDVLAIHADLERRRQFCALPYGAVLVWLVQSGRLKVHSESCMLLLLTAWMRSEEHSACSRYQLKQLACSVRVGHLNLTFLHGMLPGLKWFQECCGEELESYTLEVLQGQPGRSECRSGCHGRGSRVGPPSGIAIKRKVTAVEQEGLGVPRSYPR